jgi:polyhydroxyalkanoate synthase subunit PhaC
MTTSIATPSETEAINLAGALDLVLASAALSPARRFAPGRAGARMAGSLAKRPRVLATRGKQLGGELAKVVTGASTLAPSPRDRRFADPAWKDNGLLRRLLQAYLASSRTAETLVEDAYLDWRDAERMRFLVSNLIEAAAPSNNPFVNPQACKALIDTGGGNVTRGLRNFLSDIRTAPRVPGMVDESAFDVGGNLAMTPGAVVYRTDAFELIQYAPQTKQVRERPVLIVPPTINKYYVLDLAPGRSMVEYLVHQGQQVFVISWRNPDARHASWDGDTYGQAILDALAAVEAISGADKTLLTGICSGGILASLVMGHLAATGQDDRIAGFGLAVTMLDQTRAGLGGALLDDATAGIAVAASKARGYLDGRALAEVFAWLRPSDLIWNYWVNNYLLGKTPPAFDILYWNADTTRMTAGLHRDFVTMARSNALGEGTGTMLGTGVDLAKVSTDSYIVAGVTDHICPWQACYRSTQMLGGQSRFVLSTSGHIAAMVNPPSNPKASFLVADQNPESPSDWQAQAAKQDGSWWPDFDTWLGARAGALRPAPELGAATHPVIEPAPGRFVYDI